MRIELTSEWTRGHMARAVPGSFWDGERGAHCVDDPNQRTAAIILTLFPELSNEYPELVLLRESLASDARPFDNATATGIRIEAPTVEAQLLDEGYSFYEFQSLDLGYINAVLNEHGAGALLWDRGLGKTLGTAALIESQGAFASLVVAPNTAKHSVWGRELERFLPEHRVFVLPNLKSKRETCLEQIQAQYDGGDEAAPFIVVINYEQLAVIAGTEKYKTPSGKEKKRILDGWERLGVEWDLKVADEAHRLCNPDTLQARSLLTVPGEKFLALTGTAIQNQPEDPYGILHQMYPKDYRRKWADWNDRFVDYVKDDYGQKAIGFKAETLDELRAELGVFCVYRRKDDELDLPGKIRVPVLLDLEGKQAKAYDEMLQQFYTILEEGDVLKASNVLAQLNQLRQIATYVEGVPSVKLDYAVEQIKDSDGEPTVVFSWYKAPLLELERRLEKAGVPAVVVTGDVKQEDRSQLIEDFQRGKGQVFAGTISTLGESVTLHRASQAIRLDRHWNPAVNDQTDDRLYRIGQTRHVTITDLIARGTVDELRVLPALASKEALRRAVFGGS